jgi:hypothetical protein
MLQRSGAFPFKYLYMGINIGSSNVALPTSRLAERLKKVMGGERVRASTKGNIPLSPNRAARRPRGSLWAAARLVNRVAEECYRQMLSWWYQLRGYVVLYDRHFVFDFAERPSFEGQEPLSNRIHRIWLTHYYPQPDFVIYLDAPAKVLFARKRESNLEELERRRQALLRQGSRMPNFVRVDATQPLEKVFGEVLRHIEAFCNRKNGRFRRLQQASPASSAGPRDELVQHRLGMRSDEESRT